MRYVKPKSMTWLSGVALIFTGLAEIIVSKQLSAEAIMKIGNGFGLIGIRGAMGE